MRPAVCQLTQRDKKCASRECDVNSYVPSFVLSCLKMHILLNGDFLLLYTILKRRKFIYYTQKKKKKNIIYRAAFRLDCSSRRYTLQSCVSAARPISLFIVAGLIRVERAPIFLSSRNSLTFIIKRVFFLFFCFYCQRDSLCILDTHDHRVV